MSISMSILRIPVILGVIAGGLLAGKTIVAVGLTHPWWPLSVSGERETVIYGILKQSEPEKLTGYTLETATGDEPIDFNRFPGEAIDRILNRTVVVRGVRREGKLSILDEAGKYQVGSFMEVSWAKTNP